MKQLSQSWGRCEDLIPPSLFCHSAGHHHACFFPAVYVSAGCGVCVQHGSVDRLALTFTTDLYTQQGLVSHSSNSIVCAGGEATTGRGWWWWSDTKLVSTDAVNPRLIYLKSKCLFVEKGVKHLYLSLESYIHRNYHNSSGICFLRLCMMRSCRRERCTLSR